MSSDKPRSRTFKRAVPFSKFVRQYTPLVVPADHLTAGLAADFTMSVDNPVFKIPGPEEERDGSIPAAFAMYAPYYIGTGFTPEQIANDVARQAASYLKTLEALHGHDGYVGRMLSVLRSGNVALHGLQAIEDRNILLDVHDFLGVLTNRLHHIAPVILEDGDVTSAAAEYRECTHEIVDPYASTVLYTPTGSGYEEHFQLPEVYRSDPNNLVELGWDFFDTAALRRGAEVAALAAEKLGNPVVRSALSTHYLPPHLRRRDYMLASR